MATVSSRSLQSTATSIGAPASEPSPVEDRQVTVHIRSIADIINARHVGRALATASGFSMNGVTIITTAISEVARNIVEHAGEGRIIVRPTNGSRRQGLEIVAIDNGPGIKDIAVVLRDGYSTHRGLGMGLPGTRRLMDEFEIASVLGQGTTVTMRKRLE
jgi:serine/threonine-protein kinase RsbT